ncbi:MAG: hypothetical protein EBU90_07900 [Proteobacteria bacterium]|nr:hypothetical protein [Pseudomonadota bacterium]NBP14123.1 hypothetical protein [bacterium]
MTKIRQQINEMLKKFNIPEDFEIEKDAEQMILFALRDPNTKDVFVDNQGYLCIVQDGDTDEQNAI